MANREKQLQKYIMEYSVQMLEKQRKEIENILKVQQNYIIKDILWIFHKLFQKASQNEGKKEVSYIVISFLNTGIVNGTIELKIDLYNREILFDENPITEYYEFHYFDEIIKKDMESFKNYIERKMIRVKYQELCRYRRVCMIKYKSLMEECIQVCIEVMIRLKSFLAMKKTDNIKIMYGELMCKNTVLYEGIDSEK